jgi:hypothetical protein
MPKRTVTREVRERSASFTFEALASLVQMIDREFPLAAPDERYRYPIWRHRIEGQDETFEFDSSENFARDQLPDGIISFELSAEDAQRKLNIFVRPRIAHWWTLVLIPRPEAGAEVQGQDETWVRGTAEKLKIELGKSRTSSFWLHTDWGGWLLGALIFALVFGLYWRLVTTAASAGALSADSHLSLRYLGLYLSFPPALLGLAFLRWLWPDIELLPEAQSGSRRLVKAVGFVLLTGLLVNAVSALCFR